MPSADEVFVDFRLRSGALDAADRRRLADVVDLADHGHHGAVDVAEGDQVTAQSYDDEWTIADVASHLGSQAEIFGSFLDAGLAGDEPPGGDSFPPIWDKWNAMVPPDQASASIEANDSFVRRLEGLTPDERERFAINLFGRDTDLDGFATVKDAVANV